MRENGKLSNVIMWAFRFGAVHIHSLIKQGHQSQLKKIILSETLCTYPLTALPVCPDCIPVLCYCPVCLSVLSYLLYPICMSRLFACLSACVR